MKHSKLPGLMQSLATVHERRAVAAAQHFAVHPSDDALEELERALGTLRGVRGRLAGVTRRRLLTPAEKDALAGMIDRRES